MPEFDSTIRYAPIPGFPNYMAGSDGTVWSSLYGNWRMLHPTIDANDTGYCRVGLRVDGRYRYRRVHQLILLAFVGPCPSGLQVCHDPDPCRTNNRLENLRYGTPKSNSDDQLKHGTRCKSERRWNAQFTTESVLRVRALRKTEIFIKDIAKEVGATEAAVFFKANHGNTLPEK